MEMIGDGTRLSKKQKCKQPCQFCFSFSNLSMLAYACQARAFKDLDAAQGFHSVE